MIVLEYRYQCDYFPATAVVGHQLPHLGEVPKPCPPDDWRQLGPELICPAHEVTIRVEPRQAA
jgi:hypothetical protein